MVNNIITETQQCRACGFKELTSVLDFGETALANRYLKAEQLKEPEIKAPLEVVLCEDCGCVQLKHTVNPGLLFQEYLYASSTSGTLKEHFREYALSTIKTLGLERGKDFIVGIGGNDGPLESAYQELGFKVLNVEPARNIAALSANNGVPTLCQWFTEQTALEIVERYGRASLITCNNCLAHIPDIHEVLRGVKALLEPDGYLVIENAYLLNTIQKTLFDQFYHEHCFYWGILPLQDLFVGHEMTISHIEFNNSQEGSFRCYVRNANIVLTNVSVLEIVAQEVKQKLYSPGTYVEFRNRVDGWEQRAEETIGELLETGKSICCYGAPAKFTLISELLDLNPGVIEYVVEDSAVKVGLFTPGSHIQIVSRESFVKQPTDACLITARNYAEHIKRSNPQYTGTWIDL